MPLVRTLFTPVLSLLPDANIPRAIKKKRKENAPKPLPPKRPRALTVCNEENHLTFSNIRHAEEKASSKKQYLCTQEQSSLFSLLPLEVRQIIWRYLLGSFDLHIVRGKRKLVAIECLGEVEDSWYPPCGHLCWGNSAKAFPGYHGICPGVLIETNDCPLFPSPIPVLQTCRIIYSESIPFLYENNTFRFNHVDTIINLSQTILPSRFNMLRTVHLAYVFPFIMYGEHKNEMAVPPYDSATWEGVCRLLSKMSSLHELYMHLGGSLLDYQIDRVLKPLHQIQQTNVFEVYVAIGRDPANVYRAESMPFRFVPRKVETGKEWRCCR